MRMLCSRALAAGLLIGLAGVGPALAAPAGDAKGPASMLPGTSSHDPVNIDAGKLDYFDKEQKLVYSGGVVAVQGDSTLKASQLTIYLTKQAAKPGANQPADKGETAAASATAAGTGTAPDASASSVRHMDIKGPVTMISKDQVGTGDNGTYDRTENQVTMTGHVTLSQGTNVTKGDRLVYDLTSGQAQVFSGATNGRVQSVFTPGSAGPDTGAAAPSTATPKAKPAKPRGRASK